MNTKTKSNLNILFVEDEEKSLKYFEKVFSKYFSILTTNNIDSAWDIINDKSKKIAVVLSDQKMPGGTGVELLNRVKNKYPNIIRILTTGFADLNDSIAAINQSRVFAYLTKPWDLDEVRETLNNALAEYETQNALLSLGSSIAHEVRNPLAAISMALHQIKDYVQAKMEESGIILNAEVTGMINRMIDISFNSIKRANNIIDITLDSIKGKEPDPEAFIFLSAANIIKNAVEEYGYQNDQEKEKIHLNIDQDFIFKGDENLMIHILFNLIKNALYYLDEYPNSVITIRTAQGQDYNRLYVRDTGPGIAADKIKFLFGDFITSGKKGGTGLGLSFCKRVMTYFGGNITCASKEKEYTEFTMTFPIQQEKESKSIKADHIDKKINSKIDTKTIKILVVDDKESNLSKFKSITTSRFENVIIDTAENGKEAVRKSANNNYSLIFMDINMPIMNGIVATKKIREFDQTVPIIAYTSMDDARQEAIEAGCNDYIIKPANSELLIKTICKWNLIKYNFPSELPAQKIQSILENKKILIVDDEKVHRFMLTVYFQKRFNNVEIDEAQNGQELVDKLTKHPAGKSYDLIISDANMPVKDSIIATEEIRKYQHDNNLKKIPIIAFSADSEKERIHQFFNAGMDDYFIKGSKVENLVETILFWFQNKA